LYGIQNSNHGRIMIFAGVVPFAAQRVVIGVSGGQW
jgi:hypothetical protein